MPSLVQCLILLLLLAATHPTMSQRSRTDTLVIHFAFDRSDVRPADSAILQQAHPHPDSILIIGYTDTVGSIVYNLRLSSFRAQAAGVALLRSLLNAGTLGSPAPAIGLEARGKANPLPGADSLSRRVELFVYYKDTPAIAQAPPVDTPKARPEGEPDTTFGLDNINFVANTPILTDAAREALPASVAFLKNFADRYLEIDGYCNSPGAPLPPKDPLFILSVKRAKFIYDYLIQQGFDATHLRYKGLGNASPVVAHPTTREESDENMRVEIRVFHKPPPQY
jgi:outer membrane protein OmpA-like peptidoglycan-associated protein